MADFRSASPFGDENPARAQCLIGRGDRAGADVERLRQLAHRRQPFAGGEIAVANRVFDALRDFRRGVAINDLICGHGLLSRPFSFLRGNAPG